MLPFSRELPPFPEGLDTSDPLVFYGQTSLILPARHYSDLMLDSDASLTTIPALAADDAAPIVRAVSDAIHNG